MMSLESSSILRNTYMSHLGLEGKEHSVASLIHPAFQKSLNYKQVFYLVAYLEGLLGLKIHQRWQVTKSDFPYQDP